MNTVKTSAGTVSADQIIAFVDRIAAGYRPRRIVLFGSYACGGPTADSDVDLLTTRQRWSMSPLTAAGKIRVELGVPFAMDLIVRSEAEVRRRIAGGDFFMREVLETGITLYAADDARVGREGRIRLRRRLRGAAVSQEVGPPPAPHLPRVDRTTLGVPPVAKRDLVHRVEALRIVKPTICLPRLRTMMPLSRNSLSVARCGRRTTSPGQ